MYQSLKEIKALLDERYSRYNHFDFIATDPIQIPHRFIKKEDIEIAGLLTATIAWGQRKSIINNANRLMNMMDHSPYEFIMENNFLKDGTPISQTNTNVLRNFVHRTFNGDDLLYFLHSLKNIYTHHGGLEEVISVGYKNSETVFGALKHFRTIFLEHQHNHHVRKHLSDVTANSSAKRLNMYLRWMVRQDDNEVDFGLWKQIPMSALLLPLDLHTGDVGRALGILQRKQNDLKAVMEITEILRTFDSHDPIKYDFALFGIGAFEKKENLSLD